METLGLCLPCLFPPPCQGDGLQDCLTVSLCEFESSPDEEGSEVFRVCLRGVCFILFSCMYSMPGVLTAAGSQVVYVIEGEGEGLDQCRQLFVGSDYRQLSKPSACCAFTSLGNCTDTYLFLMDKTRGSTGQVAYQGLFRGR